MMTLEPCPFCGGKAERREWDERHPEESYGLIVSHADGCFLASFDCDDRIYDRWNTRAGDPDSTEFLNEKRESISKGARRSGHRFKL